MQINLVDLKAAMLSMVVPSRPHSSRRALRA